MVFWYYYIGAGPWWASFFLPPSFFRLFEVEDEEEVWVLLKGIPTGDVLIFAHWRLSTLTQYLTWFGKPPTSTGEAILLYRERTRFTTIEEEESSSL
jgi:hypothetical protein